MVLAPKRSEIGGRQKVEKNGDLLVLTQAGREALNDWVTDTEGPVYAITAEADTQAVAAAMARLSRNPNDLRAVLAAEFLDDQTKDTELLRRVVNSFGDDSVMQLYPIQMIFERVSNIATKEIEWGRFAAYLEQSTRYLRFDQKNSEGRYSYFRPQEFDPETKTTYEQYMDQIFDIYSDLYQKMLEHIKVTSSTPEAERDFAWRTACHAQACDTVRALLPAATESTVAFAGSSQALYNMILRMAGHDLPEIRNLGSSALTQARIVAPVFFERADMPDRGGLITNHQVEVRRELKKLLSELVPQALEKSGEQNIPVRLVSADGTERELAAKILVDSSTLSFEQALAAIDGDESDDVIGRIIQAYAGDRYNRRAKPGRAFEFPHYLFEIVCDYGAFRDIQRHRVVDGFEWQDLNPDLGHVTNDKIIEAGLGAQYDEAFRLSKELYEMLSRDERYEAQAQYATLFGHNMRFTTKVNARALLQSAELRTQPQGHPAYRRVYQQMHEAVAAVHPRIAKAMRFVSQSEDEELARLGAEKYRQQKGQ